MPPLFSALNINTHCINIFYFIPCVPLLSWHIFCLIAFSCQCSIDLVVAKIVNIVTFYSNCRPSQSQQLLLPKSHSKYRHFLWAFWCVECLATLAILFYSNTAGERIARPTLRPSNWSPSPLPSSVSESIQNISIIYCTVTQWLYIFLVVYSEEIASREVFSYIHVLFLSNCKVTIRSSRDPLLK